MSQLPETTALKFVETINVHDVDGLAGLMTEDHIFIDSLGSAVHGREAMRKGWGGYFRMVPDYTLTIEGTYSLGNTVILLGSAHGTYTNDGRLLPENAWKTPAALRAVIEDGKVKEWRVYADNEPIRQLMAKHQVKQ